MSKLYRFTSINTTNWERVQQPQITARTQNTNNSSTDLMVSQTPTHTDNFQSVRLRTPTHNFWNSTMTIISQILSHSIWLSPFPLPPTCPSLAYTNTTTPYLSLRPRQRKTISLNWKYRHKITQITMAQFVGKTSLNGTNHRIHRNKTAECVGSKNSESVSELKMVWFIYFFTYVYKTLHAHAAHHYLFRVIINQHRLSVWW